MGYDIDKVLQVKRVNPDINDMAENKLEVGILPDFFFWPNVKTTEFVWALRKYIPQVTFEKFRF